MYYPLRSSQAHTCVSVMPGVRAEEVRGVLGSVLSTFGKRLEM